MELVKCNKCLVRNYIPEDREYIFQCREKGYQLSSLGEVDSFIESHKNDDFTTNGVKYCAIANNDRIIGELFLDIRALTIVLDCVLYDEFNKRIVLIDLIVSVIRYLHKIFKHREVLFYVYKDNFEIRSILESLNFKRVHLNRENNLYTYKLYSANPNKN